MVPAVAAPVACFSWREIEEFIPSKHRSLRLSSRRREQSPDLRFKPTHWTIALDEHNYSKPGKELKQFSFSSMPPNLAILQYSWNATPSTIPLKKVKLEMEEFGDLTAYLPTVMSSYKNEANNADELNTPVFGEYLNNIIFFSL